MTLLGQWLFPETSVFATNYLPGELLHIFSVVQGAYNRLVALLFVIFFSLLQIPAPAWGCLAWLPLYDFTTFRFACAWISLCCTVISISFLCLRLSSSLIILHSLSSAAPSSLCNSGFLSSERFWWIIQEFYSFADFCKRSGVRGENWEFNM